MDEFVKEVSKTLTDRIYIPPEIKKDLKLYFSKLSEKER